jgi:hypothetical protein
MVMALFGIHTEYEVDTNKQTNKQTDKQLPVRLYNATVSTAEYKMCCHDYKSRLKLDNVKINCGLFKEIITPFVWRILENS